MFYQWQTLAISFFFVVGERSLILICDSHLDTFCDPLVAKLKNKNSETYEMVMNAFVLLIFDAVEFPQSSFLKCFASIN